MTNPYAVPDEQEEPRKTKKLRWLGGITLGVILIYAGTVWIKNWWDQL